MKYRGLLRIDYSHVGRRETGIERVTRELFSADGFKDIPVRLFTAPAGRLAVLAAQMIGLPLRALFRPRDIFVFPGFPPSPLLAFARERSVMYVHDLFLLTRRDDLNFSGRVYMAPLFALAVKRLKYFFVNSESTGRALRTVCRPDAQITPYRPRIRNVFGLSVGNRAGRELEPSVLRIAMIGTVEPRKNYIAAANICTALAIQRRSPVELNIIGRPGWGNDWSELAKSPGVVLHGTLSDAQAREVIEGADIFMCSSHDEGLGLPLLEAQHGGLPTVAPDRDVFREVLGTSGIYINPDEPYRSAEVIMKACTGTAWRDQHAMAADENLQRWNNLATNDQAHAVSFLERLLIRQGTSR